jgi:uncharacterized protein
MDPYTGKALGALRGGPLKAVAILFLALAALTSSAASASVVDPQASRPSFDCALANGQIEQAVCRNPNLAAADRLTAQLYAKARISAFGTGPSAEPGEQRAWLRERQDCAKPAPTVWTREVCLLDAYERRNFDLAVATLFTNPDLSLETVKRIGPPFAPLLEAIHIYASQPVGSDWTSPSLNGNRTRLLALLDPQFERLHRDDELSYGRDILEGEKITGATDMLRSEAKFATGLKVIATYVESDSLPLVIPCAALILHPGLTEATTPIFGSTLDNYVPRTDCETTLPPLPRLDALRDEINKGWPDCQGSIRFSAYVNFRNARIDARLGSQIERQKRVPTRRQAMPRLRGLKPASTAAAVAELSAYYQRYFSLTPDKSRYQATEAIRAIIASGHSCGD